MGLRRFINTKKALLSNSASNVYHFRLLLIARHIERLDEIILRSKDQLVAQIIQTELLLLQYQLKCSIEHDHLYQNDLRAILSN